MDFVHGFATLCIEYEMLIFHHGFILFLQAKSFLMSTIRKASNS